MHRSSLAHSPRDGSAIERRNAAAPTSGACWTAPRDTSDRKESSMNGMFASPAIGAGRRRTRARLARRLGLIGAQALGLLATPAAHAAQRTAGHAAVLPTATPLA